MTAKQRIGTWLVGTLLAGFVLGFSYRVTMEPHVCDHIVSIPYQHGERPLCVRYVNTTKGTL